MLHGNGELWTELWPDGRILARPDDVKSDGSIEIKFPWWRGVTGPLALSVDRLDVPGQSGRAIIFDGYGTSGFQATTVVFPAVGCWAITGSVGTSVLTVVEELVKP